MGKNPFGETVMKYMETMRGVYAEETWKTRMRRYRRMERVVNQLRDEKRISTSSPKSMKEEDIREFIVERMRTLASSDMVHEINSLRQLLLYAGNSSLDVCLAHNPQLKPVNRPQRKPSMDESVYRRIMDRSAQIDPRDFERLRAYALVVLCINTGTRNKEIRFANVDDLDTNNWILDIVHVKGEASYGQPRRVPVPPEARPVVTNYLLARSAWLHRRGVSSPALFPSRSPGSPYLCGNSIRKMKDLVEREIGVDFDLRQCRRTFGQRYLDRDLDIESVSVLMGHSTTRMTETFYSRRKLDTAVNRAAAVWDGTEASEE